MYVCVHGCAYYADEGQVTMATIARDEKVHLYETSRKPKNDVTKPNNKWKH